MTKNGQLTTAWEMLSSIVMLRAKAREQKLGKLLTSLHGVEVELARIIAAGDEASEKDTLASTPTLSAVGAIEEGASDRSSPRSVSGAKEARLTAVRGGRASHPRRRQDSQLQAYSQKYLALAGQLNDLMVRGEVAASGGSFSMRGGSGFETAQADDIVSEQHDLSLMMARLKASTLSSLAYKAAVLDDLAEEASDDPVQALARSLAQDVIALNEENRIAG
jgi:hypothetical protein